jgi:hypothetical protein
VLAKGEEGGVAVEFRLEFKQTAHRPAATPRKKGVCEATHHSLGDLQNAREGNPIRRQTSACTREHVCVGDSEVRRMGMSLVKFQIERRSEGGIR